MYSILEVNKETKKTINISGKKYGVSKKPQSKILPDLYIISLAKTGIKTASEEYIKSNLLE